VTRRSALTLPTLVAASAVAAGLTLVAAPAASAGAPPQGAVTSVQDTFTHKVTVSGWAYDPVNPSAAIVVAVYADGKLLGRVRTSTVNASVNRSRHISGRHGYVLRTSRSVSLRSVTIRTAVHPVASHRTMALASASVRHVRPAAGVRIVTVAKRYVHKARYVEGGATPRRGFDCSGFTKYVYAQAAAGKLPHNAAAQKSMKRMRAVSAKAARPGDLVFYHGGSGIYHVAIYAGHHKQYAAATPRDGIVYQNIWSSAVSYGHLG
jgi:cell wall-associated NlpC family hydrolase